MKNIKRLAHNRKDWDWIKKQQFGTLIPIEEVEPHVSPSGRINRKIKCYCTKTGRTGISSLNGLIRGESKGGTKYPERLYRDCENMEDYLRQFSWATHKDGYLMTTFRGKRGIGQHIIVWKAIYGDDSIPKDYVIDHYDENTSNNDISNLRLLTKQQNLIRRRPLSGLKHVKTKNNSDNYQYIVASIRMKINRKDKIMFQKSFESQIEAAHAADNWWIHECPDSIKYEHDLPGNVPGRFIPYLNFPDTI